jgi:hypothetical protein
MTFKEVNMSLGFTISYAEHRHVVCDLISNINVIWHHHHHHHHHV